ncbi:SRPBCC family protein [Nocardioides donggukensis]|uniref:SRPBCC family protein n=1 Tax=Nocardioides donggukensis TaxID=2774019 RepID=A0A927Q349_9ACTN|nr:SRPBCC family protein [Nocardioides donggukensis]MBD8871004.1 SRPBCC family protein [Nocardioides donggukensis]
MSVAPLLEESIEVSAPPATVWALVTDLPRMARWSPQVVKTIVRGGRGVGLGTRTVNINRRGPLVWPTRSKVVAFEPHSEFAFRIKDNYTIWSFSLEPTTTGTRVVQRRRTPDGTAAISNRLVDTVLGGQEQFTSELRDGMRQTLSRIKAEAEA